MVPLFLFLFLLLVTVLWRPPVAPDDAWVVSRMVGPLPQDDPDLLRHLRTRYLVPPSTRSYNLTKNTRPNSIYNNYRILDHSWKFYRQALQELFTNGGVHKEERFFVEAGALDGEFLSNTLYLEEELGWTGLLVEPDYDMFLLLQKKHRRAWSVHACLSGTHYPYTTILVKYIASTKEIPGTEMYARAHDQLREVENIYGSSDVKSGSDYDHRRLYENAQCLPLGSLLSALNVTTIDVVSLDLEGAEENVLSTFPWGMVTVRVWLIENVKRKRNKQEIMSLSLSSNKTVGSKIMKGEIIERKPVEDVARKSVSSEMPLQENQVSGRDEEERWGITSNRKIFDEKLTPAKDFGGKDFSNQRNGTKESGAEKESKKSESCGKANQDKEFDVVAFFAGKGYSLFGTHQLYQIYNHVFVNKEFPVKERNDD